MANHDPFRTPPHHGPPWLYVVGVSDRAVRMYVAGERKIPPAVAALLRLLVAGKVSGDDVRWALKRRPLGL